MAWSPVPFAPPALCALILLLLVPAAEARAQDIGAELALVHQIRMVEGAEGLRAQRAGAEAEVELNLGDLLNDGDDAYTLRGTRAAIRFTDDQSLVRMNENTVLSIRAEGDTRGTLRRIIDLEGGELWARITGRPGTETQVRTPSGVAAVRGTDLIVRYDRDTGQMTVITLDGLLEFFNDIGSVEIPGGQKVEVRAEDDEPELRPVEPEDLEASRDLLQDQADSEAGEMIDIVVPGAEGREVRLRVGRAAALELLRGGGP